MKTFEPYAIKNISLKNHVVMPPMCMYLADTDGKATEKHLLHYATRAVGGVGLIIVEATAISPEGRIQNSDLGLWCDEQIEPLKKVVQACHHHGAKMVLQIAHAGRKGFDRDNLVAPSSIAFSESYGCPHELSTEDILALAEKFAHTAKRAVEAGFDMIEIHAAHGYLLHEFLSPLSNHRQDEFGGSLINRIRFLKLVLEKVKAVIPEAMPVLLRVSASDYDVGGIDIEEMVRIINEVRHHIDMVHVSSGGLLNQGIEAYPGYQVEFSRIIRESCQTPTITVGLITDSKMTEEILKNNRADLVALGRELLRNPYWVLQHSATCGQKQFIPACYERGF